jgi:hypothetical protein
MTVTLEALMAAVSPAVNDAGMSLAHGTITFRVHEDDNGFHGVLSNERGAVAEMRLPAVVHVRTAVVAMAEIVQREVKQTFEGTGRPGRWPTCKAHPQDHSLRAAVVNREAVWVCPTTDQAVARIGGLVDHDEAARRQASEIASMMAWFARYEGLDVDEARRLAAAEGRPVRIIGADGGRRASLVPARLNVLLGPDGEPRGMEPG